MPSSSPTIYTSPQTRTVAIIGAGPGGLVAAKKLVQTNQLDVTIFEKDARIGGLWARGNLINPQMQTNFCMFTVAFSELAWGSVDLGGRPAPMYPKAWMVERYLQEYAKRFSLDKNRRLRLGTEVVRAERIGKNGRSKWKVTFVEAGQKNVKVEYFNYLVVATGYLSRPKELDCEIENVLRESSLVPMMHSTQFRDIDQLYSEVKSLPRAPKARKILVVGGSHSGSEVSTSIALQASNARWAPGAKASTFTSQDVEIVHITSHQMIAVPAFARDYEAPTCAFQPLEYKLYDRSSRPPEPISFIFGLTDPQESIGEKMMIEAYVNGEVGKAPVTNDLPAYAVVSETYSQFVQSKIIRPVVGQLKRLVTGKFDGEVTATVVMLDGELIELEGITAIVNATGFDSCGSLSFLSGEVKTELSFDPTSYRLPLVLDSSFLSQRSSVPDIAILGFTGVNWGVCEMQSRAIAAKWTQNLPASDDETEMSRAIAHHVCVLRDAIQSERRESIPQVLFGDYLGLMEQGCRELHLERVDEKYGKYGGMVCPARYIDPGSPNTEAKKMITYLYEVQSQTREASLYLARAVFLGLCGRWTSQKQTCGGAEYANEMVFHPRNPTSSGYEFEYVFVEKCTSDVGGQHSENEERRTILRYDDVYDKISGWSVSDADNVSAGELSFHIIFNKENGHMDANSCSAKVLIAPTSRSDRDSSLSYTFDFKGSNLIALHIERTLNEDFSYTVDFTRPRDEVPIIDNREAMPNAKLSEEPLVQTTEVVSVPAAQSAPI